VADERLATRIANDDSAGLGDDGATAFLNFPAFCAEIVESSRTLRRAGRRQRRQVLGGLRRRWQRRGDGRRWMPHGQWCGA
jgi:hypothetical protein